MKTIEHFKCYIEELVSQLGDVKQRQDSERRELLELREAIKSTMTVKEVANSSNNNNNNNKTLFKHSQRGSRLLHQLFPSLKRKYNLKA